MVEETDYVPVKRCSMREVTAIVRVLDKHCRTVEGSDPRRAVYDGAKGQASNIEVTDDHWVVNEVTAALGYSPAEHHAAKGRLLNRAQTIRAEEYGTLRGPIPAAEGFDPADMVERVQSLERRSASLAGELKEVRGRLASAEANVAHICAELGIEALG